MKKTHYQAPKYRPPNRWTPEQHKTVMFSQCPNCSGRVWWGDGDDRWVRIVGVRGSCGMCGREWYTADLLALREPEPEKEDKLAEVLRRWAA